MRIKKQKEKIEYNNVKEFYANRAKKYQENNPYMVTMNQDNNPELVIKRNKKEIEKLMPKLNLSINSIVLDIGCGMGRWAEAISIDIKQYCGLDFSEGLIKIANSRNNKPNFVFYEGSALELVDLLDKNQKGVLFDTVLIMGVQYIFNDEDMHSFYEQLCSVCGEHAIICMREPIGIEERLTLKEFFSEELQANYNAIYRTREEYQEYHNDILLKNGFRIKDESFLFDDAELNNREETSQYYWVFER